MIEGVEDNATVIFSSNSSCSAISREASSITSACHPPVTQGYFSTEEAPGTVFQCFYDAFCPGGPPGTCAAGRDVNSVACYDCQDRHAISTHFMPF